MGVSGSIYCIIRSAPLYGSSRQGIRIFATAGGRDQYLLEGIIIALLTIGSSFAIILTYYSSKLPIWLLRHIFILLTISIYIVFILQIWVVYVDKTRWYNLKSTMPPEIWYYITSSVKKSSNLFKRLIRISEIWLFEYKDWNNYNNKVKLLVIDYLIKIFGLQSYFPIGNLQQ